MTLFTIELEPREPVSPAPGAMHVPGWLTLGQQEWIVDRFRDWARGPVPGLDP